MNEIDSVLATVKRLLKRQGLSYREVGQALSLSEASIKRIFSSGQMTLARLAQIAALLGFSLAELTREAQTSAQPVRTLSEGEEAVLVSDMKLLLVAVCALNHWAMADIVSAYALSEAECLQRLLHLDRLGLIALLPGNRIRLLIARDFDWRADGPIRRFFRDQGLGDFLDSSFSADGERMAFVHGMLTDSAFAELAGEIAKLRKRFAELHEENLTEPLERKHGASLLVASRLGWEPAAFAELRR